MAKPITDIDESIAFSCLLTLYPDWYGKADSRDTWAVTARLVDAWREEFAAGNRIDCFTLARQMEAELRAVLDDAQRARTGQHEEA